MNKKIIALSLVTVMSLLAADNTDTNSSAEKLESISIVGDTDSHANNIIDTNRIETSGTVANPLLLLNNVAGVHVTSGSTFGLYEYSNQVNMRGFNKSQIAFLVDGVPLGSSATAGGAPVNRFVENENISSISVHQGSGALSTPSAAALGGSINYVTSLPAQEASVKASQTTASYNGSKIFARIDTGDFAKDTRAYISYSETTTNKWKNEGELKREHLDTKLVSKIADIDLQFNLSWNNRQDHDYLDITKEQFDTFGGEFGLNQNWVNNPDAAYQTSQNAYNWDTWQNARTDTLASFNLRADIGSGEIKVTPYFHDQAGTGNWAPNYVLLSDGTKDYTKQSFRQSEYETQRLGLTVNYTVDIGDHELLAGLWMEDGSRQNRRYWYNLNNQDAGWVYNQTPYLEQFNRNFDTTSLMAYVQTKLHFLDDNLVIDLGAKAQTTSVEYTDLQNAANSQPSKSSDAPFLPQLGATYKLNNQNQIFGSFAMNYAQLPDSVYTGTLYDPDIKNEESTNIDLGYRFNGDNTALTAAVYYVDYKNKIESIATTVGDIFEAGQSYAANVGGVESKGLELSGLYKLSSAWKLSGTYTFTDASYTENVGTLAISGNSVPFLPKNMLNLALDYKKNGLTFGMNTKYNKDMYGTRDNLEKIPDFALANAYMGYSKTLNHSVLKQASLMMNINNIFDKSYLATAGAFGDTVGSSTYFVGAPRTVSLTLSATF
ncbi:TonB-dependent receptor [Sulfurimonas sp. MAG313]|nr:TonB-dependent receptor [Sulfurimonas sp. MAG313]MDF1880175.1 TonB-dependent receptor [Sulfurimonas sp. MAG313]